HVVRVLPPCPWIQHQFPEAAELDRAVSRFGIAHGILHPGVGGDNEETGQPGTEEYGHRSPPVGLGTETLLAIKKPPKECRLQKERKHSFHRERLADDAACEP